MTAGFSSLSPSATDMTASAERGDSLGRRHQDGEPASLGATPANGTETVCLQCGDKGWDVALIYCDDCEKYAIHRYCLKTLPKTFDEHVVWYCEDCEPKVGRPDTNEESCSPLCEEDDLEITELVQHTKELTNIPLERLRKKKGIEKWRREKKKLKLQTEKDEEGGQLSENSTVFTSQIEVEKTKNVRLSQVNENWSSGHCDKAENIGIDLRKNSGDMWNSHEEAEFMTAPKLRKLDYLELFGEDTYVCAQPIIDPIWRGSLKFNKQGINYFGKVVAHVSNIACRKVSEEAKLLPSLLCTELHSRPEVWPKGFKNCGPSDDSIAIYIFPDNKREQEFFDSLVVEMIVNDLALRAVVSNAELLVFTSTKLPLHLWRFQSKFYLWGVFRGKQSSPVSKVDTNMPASEKDPLNAHSPGSPLSISGSDGSSSVY
ncbi:uncharacterized protein LOC115729392 [Rhodamnia argentea]|uniref:Uncharacterized protein LOC115729392 n=1 Tax=Rhodamnia argentea TaxID=178133 RepID=A0A8B8N0B6_9MYRT|nr:uncharacterized protein LOC115729392 [Rhodamnia argentea]